MKVHRRNFLCRSSMAAAFVVAGSGLAGGAAEAGETPELGELRRRVAGYAGRVMVRSDRGGEGGELHLVCEIADLGRFWSDLAAVVPAGATAHVAGNVLSYEHRGRRVRVENVWRA